jgi:hypothetical protein
LLFVSLAFAFPRKSIGNQKKIGIFIFIMYFTGLRAFKSLIQMDRCQMNNVYSLEKPDYKNLRTTHERDLSSHVIL